MRAADRDDGDGDAGPAGHGCFDEAAAEYVVTAGRPYRKGEQVYLCYGSYTDLELLEHYGFLLPKNPHDEVMLPDGTWPCETNAAAGMGKAFLHPCAFLHILACCRPAAGMCRPHGVCDGRVAVRRRRAFVGAAAAAAAALLHAWGASNARASVAGRTHQRSEREESIRAGWRCVHGGVDRRCHRCSPLATS